MFDKLLQFYYKITKEQYEIIVVEYDKEGNTSNTFTIQLKKIIETLKISQVLCRLEKIELGKTEYFLH